MPRTHNVTATVGTYESHGETKRRYFKCGSAFTNEEGQFSLKIDALPVGPEWNGWLSLYSIDENAPRYPKTAFKRTHDVLASCGEYKAKDGTQKKRRINVGSAFTDSNGQIAVKMEGNPVTPDWNGWLSFFVPIPREHDTPPPQRQQQPAAKPAPATDFDPGDDIDDDIPF